uniref:Uncharacterized protein n=1 Tax=Globisporangium ultimum (strain ATCC 200006 / CBS 805.95 / DAOM BR144) TaxID=431595 RepID=K3WLX4_GLOUD
MLTSFPSSIFKSPLTSFYINDNGFKLASVSSEQFDFFAGLSNFQADFAESTSCGDGGELVNLKGNKICRVKVANPVNPTVLPHATNKSDS